MFISNKKIILSIFKFYYSIKMKPTFKKLAEIIEFNREVLITKNNLVENLYNCNHEYKLLQ